MTRCCAMVRRAAAVTPVKDMQRVRATGRMEGARPRGGCQDRSGVR